MALGYFILDDDDNPVEVHDVITWGRWREANRERMIVEHTRLPESASGHYVLVSTVFLGIDHSFVFGRDDEHAPVLWETMIFGGPEDHYQRRYTSRPLAVEGHSEAVARACAAAGIEVPIPPARIR